MDFDGISLKTKGKPGENQVETGLVKAMAMADGTDAKWRAQQSEFELESGGRARAMSRARRSSARTQHVLD